MEQFPAAGLPPVHVGVAAGPVVAQGGDYFGRTVNLAGRIAGRAGPGQVLVSQSVADAAPPRGDLRRAEAGAELEASPIPCGSTPPASSPTTKRPDGGGRSTTTAPPTIPARCATTSTPSPPGADLDPQATPGLTVQVMLNTAAYDAEVDFWTGLMRARPVASWAHGPGGSRRPARVMDNQPSGPPPPADRSALTESLTQHWSGAAVGEASSLWPSAGSWSASSPSGWPLLRRRASLPVGLLVAVGAPAQVVGFALAPLVSPALSAVAVLGSVALASAWPGLATECGSIRCPDRRSPPPAADRHPATQPNELRRHGIEGIGAKLRHGGLLRSMGRWPQGMHHTALLEGGTGVSTAPAGHRGQGLHLVFPEGAAVGIECALRIKAAHRYGAAVADVDPAWSAGVWWFTQ